MINSSSASLLLTNSQKQFYAKALVLIFAFCCKHFRIKSQLSIERQHFAILYIPFDLKLKCLNQSQKLISCLNHVDFNALFYKQSCLHQLIDLPPAFKQKFPGRDNRSQFVSLFSYLFFYPYKINLEPCYFQSIVYLINLSMTFYISSPYLQVTRSLWSSHVTCSHITRTATITTYFSISIL